ncbi:MAG TPA: PBP1A family penicillin-binding protein [Solirubrobacterales bacterium]|jgi:penicillin-binding protein 1A|nr:PBP1A family penicillin-binding protein [Solirubrobacterales bacterium]
MSLRSRQRRQTRTRGSVGKTIVAVAAGVLALVACAAGGLAIWVLNVAADAPDIDTLRPANDGANSQVFDSAGNSLGYVQSDILREPVKLKKIPKDLQEATIAIEDSNFYEHGGVDYGAIIRAAVANAEAGEVKQGASTITQQLVRNLYIEDPKDTIERKIKEARMAQQYEEEHSKNQILDEYLNTATYGTNNGKSSVGVQAAAEAFFDKDVEDLGLRESAMLAGLPQAPSEYNPFTNPNAAIKRRNEVLDAMVDQGYITPAKAAKVKDTGPGLQAGDKYLKRSQPFFFDFVQNELIDKYGLKKVRQGGLKVYTTLNPTDQAAAEQAILNAPPVYGAARALVSTDTNTGAILAMASSQSYDTSQFNLAATGERQPGSSFKPFVLTTAVNQGMDPETTTFPAPSTITLTPPGSEPWTVSGGAGGSITLADATANSVNTVFAQLGVDVGPANFDEMAHKMGITSELQGVYAEALGGTSTCCTVLEMSNAYATLANGGVHHDPTAITKVVFPNGKVDKPEDSEGTRVISDGVAYTVANVMEGTLDFGTAQGYDLPGCTAAGKTGTTEEQSDAWFVGYTPDVSTAVWTGNPDARTPLPGYGATLSAPVWQDYMEVAATKGCRDFPAPKDPADLSTYSSSSAASTSTYDTTSTTTTTTPTTTTPAATGGDTNGDGYPDNAYAPGIQGNGGN